MRALFLSNDNCSFRYFVQRPVITGFSTLGTGSMAVERVPSDEFGDGLSDRASDPLFRACGIGLGPAFTRARRARRTTRLPGWTDESPTRNRRSQRLTRAPRVTGLRAPCRASATENQEAA
jgi:hypothetical protein